MSTATRGAVTPRFTRPLAVLLAVAAAVAARPSQLAVVTPFPCIAQGADELRRLLVRRHGASGKDDHGR